MSSQSPALPAPMADIKSEDNASAEVDATSKETDPPISNYVSGTTLKKKDFDVMTNIIHRIINYRDKEYVLRPLSGNSRTEAN
jgi:hypothetical protein